MDKKIFKSGFDGTLEICDNFTMAEDVLTCGNSFFDRSYFGTRILILPPLPGDEILIAGNTIFNLAQAKAEIFIAYSVKEKINAAALKILGVQSDKIIFFADKAELKKILLELRANVIFCADFDEQPQFKNLSEILKRLWAKFCANKKIISPKFIKNLPARRL